MSEMREQLERLRKPFDYKYNRILDEVLLFLPPFEVLEKRIEELESRIEELEGRDERTED